MKTRALYLLILLAAITGLVLVVRQRLAKHSAGDAQRLPTGPSAQPGWQWARGSRHGTVQFPVTEAKVPVSVRPVVGLEHDTSIGARMSALGRLGSELTAEEHEALIGFLLASANLNGLEPRYTYWLKNEVMGRLVDQTGSNQQATAVLAAVYDDHQQDPVLRDYAIQHLSVRHGKAANPAERQVIQQVLWEATADHDGAIAGTALLALNRLSGTKPDGVASAVSAEDAGGNRGTVATTPIIDRARLIEIALRIAADPQSSEPVRMTALQVCARLNAAEALPLAWQLAHSGASVTARITAVAAIGLLGDREDVPWLESLAAGSEHRLQPAAQAAAKRIKLRVEDAAQRVGSS